ncbi:hypothetical protein [Brevibacillus borstelensis]|uniref:hypothetical protein n=1 Tax=Brevibacillus borstelensis TaxID=45462 RepID=UPI00287F3FA7|nr:hypothetical protein [Brevibacillus borstelensis]WNF07280.1 hypothetical protein RFB14_07580 [Brevibacillus borstelensis]
MAQYNTMVITELGKILYAKSQTGKPLVYTKMQIGSGQALGDPSNLTNLVQPIGDPFPISSFVVNGDTAQIKAIFENTNVTQTTYACELGLFANDPDYGEILYAYANAEANGDYIPPIAAGPFSKEFQINVVVGNATSVTAEIPPNAYVTYTEFMDHVNNTEIHIPRSEFISAINNLQNQIDTIKATFPDSFTHNLFDDGLETIDEISLTNGYYNQAYTRLEV